ncbi:MAG: ABC transporter permease [Bacteroidota bacterium]
MRSFFFEVFEGLRIASRAIWSNRLRSLLTTLGIIIGILSVTTMVTIINGVEKDFEEEMSALGADVLYIQKWPWVQGPGSKWWEYWNRPNIRENLAEAINERSDYALAAVPVASTSRTVRYADKDIRGVQVQGASADYPIVHSVDLAAGRFFTEIENRNSRYVAVIGAGIAERLFPVEEPIGKEIRVGGDRVRVIGVTAKQGSGTDVGASEDNRVMIPFNVFRSEFGMRWRSISVEVKVADVDLMEEATDEITGILRTARKLDALEDDDFEINQAQSVAEALAPVKVAIYGIGIFLTALSLLVGGIGVMNIMFVSVKERTKEIGIRKAIGAKRRTILLQFLVEAVIVCIIGGAIAVVIALLLTAVISSFLPAYLPFSTVVVAFVICVLIGVVFGLAPAWTASKAEPIVALRYE